MPEIHLYPATATPTDPDESDAVANRIQGTVFHSDVDTWVVALEWFAPQTLPAFCSLSLWTLTGDSPLATTGTRLDLATFTVASMTAGDWNRINLPAARFLQAGRPMYVQVHTDGHYVSSDPGNFPFESDDGSLHAYAAADSGNGRWTNSGDNSQIAHTNIGAGDGFDFFVGVITDTDVGVVLATLAIELPEIASEMTAASAATATLNINIPRPLTDVDTQAVAGAAIDLNLPDYDVTTETQAVAGASIAVNLPRPTTTMSVPESSSATLSIVLPAVPEVGFDAEPFAGGSLAIVLPAVPAVEFGADADVTAAVALVLPAVPAAELHAGAQVAAAVAVTLPRPVSVFEGLRSIDVVIGVVLPSVWWLARAYHSIGAELTIVLPALASTGAAGDGSQDDVTGVIAGDGTETVVVIRPPGRDRFGDPLAGASPEHEIAGCLFAPGQSTEPGFADNMIDTDGTIYAPPGSDFLATDRVRIRSEIYSVVGKPQTWGTAGIVVVVRRVTG